MEDQAGTEVGVDWKSDELTSKMGEWNGQKSNIRRVNSGRLLSSLSVSNM